MSKLETNTIDTISGSTNLTLGGTNATDITIPSGVTVAGFKSTGIDDNATSTAITIDSSQNVGIGTASPTVPSATGGSTGLHLHNSATNGASVIHLTNGDTGTGNTDGAVLEVWENENVYLWNYENTNTIFATNNTERMRIYSNGDITFNTTERTPGSGNTSVGCAINGADVVIGSRAAGASGLFNRNGDGEVVRIHKSGNLEGNITVSGSTVSYNGFTGTHWSRFTDNSTPNILRGTVLETLDEMCDWYNLEFDVTTQDEDGNDVTTTKKVPHVLADGQSVGDVITYNHEGTDYQATIVKETDIKHMKSKVSDTVDAKNVYGVFSAYDLDGEGYNDFYVASVGTFVVRIKQGETVAKGDLLQSNGDGTAKVQTDDNIKSSSFAKVLSTTVIETYDDGSFIVPCSLMC